MIEGLDDLREIHQRAGEAIDFIDDDGVDLAVPNVLSPARDCQIRRPTPPKFIVPLHRFKERSHSPVYEKILVL